MKKPTETYNRDQLECPYCGRMQSEPEDLGDGGEGCGQTECGHCEREFIWSRSFTVSYRGIPNTETP